jgi:exosome complex component RRP45
MTIISGYRQTDEEVLVSRLIEKAMRRSRALDTEGLCIVAGEKVEAMLPMSNFH